MSAVQQRLDWDWTHQTRKLCWRCPKEAERCNQQNPTKSNRKRNFSTTQIVLIIQTLCWWNSNIPRMLSRMSDEQAWCYHVLWELYAPCPTFWRERIRSACPTQRMTNALNVGLTAKMSPPPLNLLLLLTLSMHPEPTGLNLIKEKLSHKQYKKPQYLQRQFPS